MSAPDDEALARELHRELNVGPRRRQRRPPPPPRKREAQGKRERPDAESTEDGSTTDDSDDFSTRVPPKTSPGVSQQRPSEGGESVDARPTPKPPSAGFERSATAAASLHQRSESLPPSDTSDASGTRPKLKAVVPGTPLTKAKSIQPTSARKHPSGTALPSPPNKKHKSTAYTPMKSKQAIKDPAQVVPPAAAAQPAVPPKSNPLQVPQHGPNAAPQLSRPPRKPAATPVAATTPRAAPSAAPSVAPSTSPDKTATAALSLVFKGPGVVRPTPTSASTSSKAADAPASGPTAALQIAPLHLKREASTPGAQSAQSPVKRARINDPASTQPPQAAARVPSPPVKRDASMPQIPAGPPPPPRDTKTPPGSSAANPVAQASPAHAVKPEKVSSNAEISPAKLDRLPAKGDKRHGEASKTPANAAKAPVHTAKSPAQAGKPSPTVSKPPPQAEKPPAHADRPPAILVKSPAKVANQAPKIDKAKANRSPFRAERSPVKADKASAKADNLPVTAHTPSAKDGAPVAKSEPSTKVKFQEQQASAKHEGDMRTANRAAQPSNAALATPEPQGATAETDQPPVNLSPAEAMARKAAYDWLNCFPPDYEPGMFLCQDSAASFCVWLKSEDSATRAALGHAVSMHYPLCTLPSNKFEDMDITMVDMRQRRYMHFKPRATQTADFITWDDAIASTTHMLMHAQA